MEAHKRSSNTYKVIKHNGGKNALTFKFEIFAFKQT